VPKSVEEGSIGGDSMMDGLNFTADGTEFSLEELRAGLQLLQERQKYERNARAKRFRACMIKTQMMRIAEVEGSIGESL